MASIEPKPRRILGPLYRFLAHKLPLASPADMATVTLYGGGMTQEHNWFSRRLFPRFVRKIPVDPHAIERLKERAREGTLIYITPYIGHLEYQFVNAMVLVHGLPLARFVNGLETAWWRPLRRIGQIWRLRFEQWSQQGGPLPHPVRSGYLAGLLSARESVLIRLKTSRAYDDLFWEDPAEDPLVPLVHTQRAINRPFFLVPIQLVWDRRPERMQKGLVDLLFGERENPGWIRRSIRFWRNYRSRAVCQIGEPVALPHFLERTGATGDQDAARAVREHLLRIIQQERKGMTGPPLKPRAWILDQICGSERAQRTIYENARAAGTPVDAVQQLARRYANEIAADIRFHYIEVADWILRWVFHAIYDGLAVDEAGLAKVKQAIAAGPVILVPNHRSHTDALLLSYVFYQHRLPLPHVAGGINMAFWPAGPFFRRCGAFFLRRTFRDNPLYRAVFEAYLHLLVREGYCLEFFIEGGRSRTGKSLQPRMGILAMLTDAMREGVVKDLQLVPVAVTYDQVIEQGAYLRELAGGTKPPERGWHLLRLRRYLRRRYGRIYLNFGDPVRFSEAIAAVAPTVSDPTAVANNQKPAIVQHLARTIMYGINKETVVTPAALAATALLLPVKRAVTEAELTETIAQLCRYLTWKGAQFSELLLADRERAIREALQRFAAGPGRLIARHDEFPPTCYVLDESRRIQLDYSKNTLIHFFVSLSCCAVILRTHFLRGATEIAYAAIETDYALCKQLFRHEFTFSTRFRTVDHLQRIFRYLADAGFVETPEGEQPVIRVTAPGATSLRLFAGLLRNFFEAYKVAILAGAQLPAEGIEAKALPKLLLRYGDHLLRLGQIRCPEAISQANFENAISAYEEMGFLTPAGEGGKGRSLLRWRAEHPLLKRLQQQLEEWC